MIGVSLIAGGIAGHYWSTVREDTVWDGERHGGELKQMILFLALVFSAACIGANDRLLEWCILRRVTIVHMDIEKPSGEQIMIPAAKVWRYMSVASLLSILQTRSLFFARIATFDGGGPLG